MQEHNKIEQGQKYQRQDAESQVKPVCLFLQKGEDKSNKMKRSLQKFYQAINIFSQDIFPEPLINLERCMKLCSIDNDYFIEHLYLCTPCTGFKVQADISNMWKSWIAKLVRHIEFFKKPFRNMLK